MSDELVHGRVAGALAGPLLDVAARLPSVEALADRVMEISEDVTLAEALEIGAVAREVAIEMVQGVFEASFRALSAAVEEGDAEAVGRLIMEALERKLNERGMHES